MLQKYFCQTENTCPFGPFLWKRRIHCSKKDQMTKGARRTEEKQGSCHCIYKTSASQTTTLLHAIQHHTLLNHYFEPYHTIPFPNKLYHTITYNTIPYHTIPYHTIPYRPTTAAQTSSLFTLFFVFILHAPYINCNHL